MSNLEKIKKELLENGKEAGKVAINTIKIAKNGKNLVTGIGQAAGSNEDGEPKDKVDSAKDVAKDVAKFAVSAGQLAKSTKKLIGRKR